MDRGQLLSGRVLVTGATGGIGQAIARACAARGADLVLTGRRADVLESLAAELGARAAVRDLSRREEVGTLVEEAGELDVVVANAALPASGLLDDLSPEQIDRMLDVNLRAPIVLARALAPVLAARGHGHLVFIASLSGKTAGPASSMYSATKFGLRGFALGLREDMRAHGVGVSLVSPGFIRDAGMYAKTGIALPLGVGTRSPEQVADAVVRVIETNRTEIDVAPAGLRAGAVAGAVAPGPAAWVSRKLGSHRLGAQFADRQRHDR